MESKGRHRKLQGKGVPKTKAERWTQANPPRTDFIQVCPGGVGQSTNARGKESRAKNVKRSSEGTLKGKRKLKGTIKDILKGKRNLKGDLKELYKKP